MFGKIRARRHCYGFIEAQNPDGIVQDYYYYEYNMAKGFYFDDLKIGDSVEFEIEETSRGLQAIQLKIIR